MPQKPNRVLLEFEKPLLELYKKIDDLKMQDMDMSEEIKMLEKRIETLQRDIFSNLTPIQIVQVARHIKRPTTLDLINLIFNDFVEMRGDRNFSDDPAMVGGLAMLPGCKKSNPLGETIFDQPVVLIGQQKGSNTKENIKRNFGMAHPEGYRKALRLMHLAERFNAPIISFIDTPGAFCGIGAEERGQAEAIAKNLRSMAGLSVPFISIVIGEGGSGGALGIGMGNRVLMLEFSIYSVISPEGCASILFRDAKKAPHAAEVSKITAIDLLEMNVIDEIIKEPVGGAHNNYKETALNIGSAIKKHLSDLARLSSRELIADRYRKYRNMGYFTEE
ncbi:acetyl-CoA carboxylase carboxyltransferase subunit alpha [candidate division WOR-1 bacterium RIFOXYA12_FULL_43_27]|uniref:Acetyl-coenzyme A carboxylase carboxyl transferase subunit alpha n=1 Tax=candidate division WOR-1 bacterium RIFOXYC2_FULL_46_14 TaxID=1802587 RepID=A0A1F4U7P9_UNCSA|nr:MAG: acetyl-CoA carboxylase carboxyltransferase subunit alpha [candidate division WOR-1 bacterium RIFOXYA12_FULL_43_27]OGC19332.1 MAG: acetyl-CoA carboxylase carboxyltransferase subunit alpha [candidate division WOR-1 bacterium RIFOXYB2_FULL_46_45]OGC30321.1 MAG: acetyl-CoA carboxylase carboxyltransferase subunit alpha [candidate division WOR-1 bacterium RIFOXYA2_FULL_46_56]OGC40922.1 MAG: acetyl-CoA carboxylase carboxyltransferase subunit alpha [candidate division WOR-1 bacterium RIFOXYC2_FU